ncbi:MAG: hypothetical protein AB7E72_10945 [Lysobacterales bacterium]
MSPSIPHQISAAGYRFRHAPELLSGTAAVAPAFGTALAAELCETPVRVAVAEAAPIFDLELAQFGAYRFDAASSRYAVLREADSPQLTREALEGPVLLHALAHHRVYVVHASALKGEDGKALLFCAPSGIGKSTFARVAQALGWQRLADDLLPLARTSDGGIQALPHLQQPKLLSAEQYPADAARALPLAAFIELRRGSVAGIRRLAGAEVLARVLRHSVATRIYASACLAAHLDFCASCAAEAGWGLLRVAELTVAVRPDDIGGAVQEALALLQSTLR